MLNDAKIITVEEFEARIASIEIRTADVAVAVTNAKEALTYAESAAQIALHDDGSMEPEELLEHRSRVNRTLELCRIETGRLENDAAKASALYVESLNKFANDLLPFLFQYSSEREAAIIQQLRELAGDGYESMKYRFDLENFARNCKGVDDRRNIAQRIQRHLTSANRNSANLKALIVSALALIQPAAEA